MKRGIAYIQRYRGTGAVLALDVDRLKRVNDECGHAAGDALLKAIAGFLLRQTRASDLVGRLGGDEFAVVLWNLSEADALAKAASLEAGIDGLVTTYRGRPIAAGASREWRSSPRTTTRRRFWSGRTRRCTRASGSAARAGR